MTSSSIPTVRSCYAKSRTLNFPAASLGGRRPCCCRRARARPRPTASSGAQARAGPCCDGRRRSRHSTTRRDPERGQTRSVPAGRRPMRRVWLGLRDPVRPHQSVLARWCLDGREPADPLRGLQPEEGRQSRLIADCQEIRPPSVLAIQSSREEVRPTRGNRMSRREIPRVKRRHIQSASPGRRFLPPASLRNIGTPSHAAPDSRAGAVRRASAQTNRRHGATAKSQSLLRTAGAIRLEFRRGSER
jgi:hypothetical protein